MKQTMCTDTTSLGARCAIGDSSNLMPVCAQVGVKHMQTGAAASGFKHPTLRSKQSSLSLRVHLPAMGSCLLRSTR